MNIEFRTYSLTEFKRNTLEFLTKLKEDGLPIILTVNGKPEVVIQDVRSYQKLLTIQERFKVLDGIRRGLGCIERGETQPFEEFFDELFKEIDAGMLNNNS